MPAPGNTDEFRRRRLLEWEGNPLEVAMRTNPDKSPVVEKILSEVEQLGASNTEEQMSMFPVQQSDPEYTSFSTAQLRAEIARLQDWIDDLQAGLYVNCVYCGHRYGPDDSTPVSQAEILHRHIAGCTAHPMYKIKLENDRLRDTILTLRDNLTEILKG